MQHGQNWYKTQLLCLASVRIQTSYVLTVRRCRPYLAKLSSTLLIRHNAPPIRFYIIRVLQL